MPAWWFGTTNPGPWRDLLEHPIAPGNRFDDLPAGQVADIALAPHAVGSPCAGLDEAVVLARIALDQLREISMENAGDLCISCSSRICWPNASGASGWSHDACSGVI